MSDKNPELSDKCPQCNSSKVAAGSVLSQPDYFYAGAYFRPKELKPFALTGINIRFKNIFNACLDCGCIWSEVSNDKLKSVIAGKGNKTIKEKLGLT